MIVLQPQKQFLNYVSSCHKNHAIVLLAHITQYEEMKKIIKLKKPNKLGAQAVSLCICKEIKEHTGTIQYINNT
jgi:hypothetical protein